MVDILGCKPTYVYVGGPVCRKNWELLHRENSSGRWNQLDKVGDFTAWAPANSEKEKCLSGNRKSGVRSQWSHVIPREYKYSTVAKRTFQRLPFNNLCWQLIVDGAAHLLESLRYDLDGPKNWHTGAQNDYGSWSFFPWNLHKFRLMIQFSPSSLFAVKTKTIVFS